MPTTETPRWRTEHDVRTGALRGVEVPSSPLTTAVLAEACALASMCHERLRHRSPTVWIHAGAHLPSVDLVAMVDTAVRSLPAPHLLGIEVDLRDIEPAGTVGLRVIDALASIGVELAVDHFGHRTLVSLDDLHRMPATVLKLDRTITSAIGEDDRTAEHVRALIDIAHLIGKSVVGRGIDEAWQLGWMRQAGADLAEGAALPEVAEVPLDRMGRFPTMGVGGRFVPSGHGRSTGG